MKIAHLSDLHFGRRISAAKLEALGEDIKTQETDLVVVSGDITDRGLVWEFKTARQFLEALGSPYICVPGNREISVTAPWEWIFPPLGMTRYRRFFGQRDRVVFICEPRQVVFFGLNSVHPFPSWVGRIARETRYWLREQAAGFPNYFKGLFLHHPVLPVIRGSSVWAHSLSDAGEILNICTQAGISLILQGHKHRSAVMELRVPDRNALVVVSCGGAPLMPHWDSAYHIIDVSPSLIVARPREFDDGRFKGKGTWRFPLRPPESATDGPSS